MRFRGVRARVFNDAQEREELRLDVFFPRRGEVVARGSSGLERVRGVRHRGEDTLELVLIWVSEQRVVRRGDVLVRARAFSARGGRRVEGFFVEGQRGSKVVVLCLAGGGNDGFTEELRSAFAYPRRDFFLERVRGDDFGHGVVRYGVVRFVTAVGANVFGSLNISSSQAGWACARHFLVRAGLTARRTLSRAPCSPSPARGIPCPTMPLDGVRTRVASRPPLRPTASRGTAARASNA